MEIKDYPKLHSPFKRKMINNHYVVTPEIEEGYEWVFEDDSVRAIEKLDGTNVSIVIENGIVTSVWNRKNKIEFINKNKRFIIDGLLNSCEKGYMKDLKDGQHFGEVIGPKMDGNPYRLDKHLWIPFNTYSWNHLSYKSWGKYPKTFESISEWFKDLMPLFALKSGQKDGFVEGVVFTHPDGRKAKLRRDMFQWFHEN